MRTNHISVRALISFLLLFPAVFCGAEILCDCGESCGACGGATPAYMLASLNLQGCEKDAEFFASAAGAYPCFGGTMDVVLKQDELYSCGYYCEGPAFQVEGSEFDWRYVFYLDFAGEFGATEFWLILQQDCGGWFDMYWSVAATEQSCERTGSAEFESLCNAPMPDIESGEVSWRQAVLADGNCAGCDENEPNENCDEFDCDSLGQYMMMQGPDAYYSGPAKIYSSPMCGANSKNGNKIRTARIYCSGSQFVSSQGVSSSPGDIVVSAMQSSCAQGDSAEFVIDARRGRGTVVLTVDFYRKPASDECVALKTTKTVVIEVEPDSGDLCCQNEFRPVLLKGSPGNVSSPVRAGGNPLDEWPRARVYENQSDTDIEAILPGRFNPVFFNESKPAQYMAGFVAAIDDANAVVITTGEKVKYIYSPGDDYKISVIKNSQDVNIVEFVYGGNGLPIRQNDLLDSSLYISYEYDSNGFMTGIVEHSGGDLRQFNIEYDSTGRVSFVSGGACSECGRVGNRRYFYNADGTLKYEKTAAGETIYEYVFDVQGRLVEKWLGEKSENKPVRLVKYAATDSGYIADINDYIDDENRRVVREYRTDGGIVSSRISYQTLNDSQGSPQGQSFAEYFIYDYNQADGTVARMTEIKPAAGYNGQGQPVCVRTETIYDSKTGDVLKQTVYDANNIATVIFENIYQYLDSSGVETSDVNQIYTARVVESVDVYGANTVYAYCDGSGYPDTVLFAESQGGLSGGQLKHQFIYDSAKRIVSHRFIENKSDTTELTVNYGYDIFGNQLIEQSTDGNDVNDIAEYFYNGYNQIVRIKTAGGIVFGREYDSYGRLAGEFTVADGNDISADEPNLVSQKKYVYDSNGLLAIKAEAIDGGAFEFDNPQGWVYTAYEYDIFGGIIKIIEDANGANLQTAFEYNRQGEITKVVSPGGKWVESFRDGRGLLTAEITGSGGADILVKEYQYDENGNCIRQNEANGEMSLFEYDQFDRLAAHRQLSSLDANISIDIFYEYNSAGEILKQSAFGNAETVYDYDELGRLWIERQRKTADVNDDANDFISLYVYDCFDNATKKIIKGVGSANIGAIENNDIVISYEYDAKSRVKKIVDAENKAVSFAYNPDGRVKSVIDSLNLQAVNTIDGYGRIVKTQTPAGNYKITQYDSLDRILRETLYDFNDTAANQRRFEYDNSGNVIRAITMAEAARGGDANSLVDSIFLCDYNDASGFCDSERFVFDGGKEAERKFEYDIVGRLIKITDAAGNEAKILYDANWPGRIAGQEITYFDPCEPITVRTFLEYDQFGRLKSSRVFDNNSGNFDDLVAEFEYDDAGNVVRQVKSGGREVIYQYDSFSNLVKTIEDANRITEFEYDRLGRQLAVVAIDDSEQRTQYEYDKNGRCVKIIFADGKEEIYQYDAVGKIIEKTNRGGQKIYFAYDDEDNLIELADDVNEPGYRIEFEYDPQGLITYAGKIAGGQTVSRNYFEYNGFGRVKKETAVLFANAPVEIEYAYDQQGNVVGRGIGSAAYGFGYDGLGRIRTIGRNGESLAEIDYFGSAVSRQKIVPADIEYAAGFDEIARINRCTATSSGSGVVFDLQYGYDGASNRRPAGRDFRYDKLSQITKADYGEDISEEFFYNRFGSRSVVEDKYDFTETYYHNELNQYTKISTDVHFFGFVLDANLYWDDNGNLSYDDSGGFQYEYDILNNLVKVLCDTETAAEFYYDALGRRIRKKTASDDRFYLFDLNNRIIAEYAGGETGLNLLFEYVYGSGLTDIVAKFPAEASVDGNGVEELMEFCRTYLYQSGQGEFDPNFDYDSSGIVNLEDFAVFANENIIVFGQPQDESRWYYFRDALGSVAAIVDESGDISQFEYDAFGRNNSQDGESGFRFGGYYWDAEIGKYYCGNRYYDPDMGIFISADALGFADGFNLYAYARNNPLLLSDSLGLKSSAIDDIKFLTGFGKARAEAKRISETVRQRCEKLQAECAQKPCVENLPNPACGRAGRCLELYKNAMEFDDSLNAKCAQAAAMGTLAGATQGLLNTVNGVQDGLIGTANLGLGIWNYSGALIYDKKLDYIDSPDWSKGLVTQEGDLPHGASKFLGGEGALTLATAGVNQWKNVRLAGKMRPSGQSALAVREGVYEFTASSGKTYVGQSANIPKRIAQHIKRGKMLAEDAGTLKATQVGGGRVAREIVEQGRIDRLGGIKNLENVKNVIGPARKHLLTR